MSTGFPISTSGEGQRGRVLLIEDDRSLLETLRRVLEIGGGYEVVGFTSGAVALVAAMEGDFQVVVTDLKMPETSGMDVVSTLHEKRPNLPVILLTGHHTTETAIQAIKFGAYDYILKPPEPEELLALIEKAVADSRPISIPVDLGNGTMAKETILGSSRVMQNVCKQIGRIAHIPVTVLIRGEAGTGKELVARALHHHGARANEPLIEVYCAGTPELVLESELFGHEPGAIPGAETRRIGRIEQANHGTILLDEIGELSLKAQGGLMRMLQDGTIQRLGGPNPISVDTRVIAVTHHDLELAIEQKRFREDLFLLLNDAAITLPPLRDRREDIPELVRSFLQRSGAELGIAHASMPTDDAMVQLREHRWPGNVRELQTVVRKALLLARGFPITCEIVDRALAQTSLPRPAADQTIAEFVSDLLSKAEQGKVQDLVKMFHEAGERELYGKAIQRANGDQTKAAALLGVSGQLLRQKLLRYGLLSGGADDGGIGPDSFEPVVPDYQLLRPIGAGSFGQVWLAQTLVGVFRAIKIIRRKSFQNTIQFDREFSALRKIESISTHESLVDVLHVGRNEEERFYYYVMELADDLLTARNVNPQTYVPRTLKAEIASRGKLPVNECLKIGLALAIILDRLHKKGLIHRDIKPSNIIFVDGKPKLADIGLVTATGGDTFVGTVGYIPPEGPGKEQADIFGLGMVLYEMNTARNIVDFPTIPADLTDRERGFHAIVLKACHPDSKQRYSSARHLVDALRHVQRGLEPP